MKKVVVISMGLILFVGCQPMEEVSPEDMKNLSGQVDQLSGQVDDYQVMLDNLVVILEKHGIDGEIRTTTDKVSKELDRVQAQLRGVTEALRTAEYTGDTGLITLLQGAQAANKASSPFNPWSIYIDVALSGALVVLGLFAKKKSNEATTNAEVAEVANAKYTAHKIAVEELKVEKPELAAEIYKKVGEARSKVGVA
jgi:hypothetical protein